MNHSHHHHQPKVVGLGEVLWDVYPDGETFGGAPANFACHCRSLGADAAIASAVGEDERGSRALAFLNEHRVDTSGIAVLDGLPTGAVFVTLDDSAKPTYDIREGAAWDALPWSEALGELAAKAEAVCFGSLGQRSATSRNTIQRFLSSTRSNALRIFDINLRQHYHSPDLVSASLEAANVLKINDEELPALAGWLGLPGEAEQQLASLVERFSLLLAVLTCGPRGARMVTRDATSFATPPPAKVVSTVGAGDAFTAAVAMGLLANQSLDQINRRANAVAAYVCTQQGAVPPLPADLV